VLVSIVIFPRLSFRPTATANKVQRVAGVDKSQRSLDQLGMTREKDTRSGSIHDTRGESVHDLSDGLTTG